MKKALLLLLIFGLGYASDGEAKLKPQKKIVRLTEALVVYRMNRPDGSVVRSASFNNPYLLGALRFDLHRKGSKRYDSTGCMDIISITATWDNGETSTYHKEGGYLVKNDGSKGFWMRMHTFILLSVAIEGVEKTKIEQVP